MKADDSHVTVQDEPTKALQLDLIAERGRGPTRQAGPVVRQDGETIVIDIPMTFRHKYGRKEIVPPAGAGNRAMRQSATPSPLALAVARAFRWQEMIETGQAKSNCDLARKLKLDQSYVARTIRLASLAPEIIETIRSGDEPEGLGLNLLRQDVPLLWSQQRTTLAAGKLNSAPCPLLAGVGVRGPPLHETESPTPP